MTHTFRQTIDGIEYEVTTEPGPDAQGPYLPDGTYSPITTSKILSCRMVNDADWQRERTRLQAIADTERESVLARRQVARSVERRALLVAAVVIVGAVLVALTGCGSQEAPIEPVSVVQDEASPSAQPAAVETEAVDSEPAVEAVPFGQEVALGRVGTLKVSELEPGVYAAEMMTSSLVTLDGTFVGVDRAGVEHDGASLVEEQYGKPLSANGYGGDRITFGTDVIVSITYTGNGETITWAAS